MKLKNYVRLVFLGLMTWFVASCATTPARVADTLPRFHESDKADVVFRFATWDSIYMLKPNTRENGFLPLMNREEVVRRLGRPELGHNLAVVILGFRNVPEIEAKMFREWKAFLSEHGFHRIVLLRSAMHREIDGLAIVYDSAALGQTAGSGRTADSVASVTPTR